MSKQNARAVHAPLALSILPAEDTDERIPLGVFADAVAGWAGLVRRVTLEQSGARPLVQWVVQGLRVGSTHVELAPLLTPKTDDEIAAAEAVREDVPRIVVDRLERIEHGTDPLEVFSTEAAEDARVLVRSLMDPRILVIMIRNLEREIGLSREGAGQQRVAPPKLRSIGSVEGQLKAISFSETWPYFSVYRSSGGRAIKCYFDEHRFLPQVIDNLRQRVLVSGRISRAEDGTPVMVSDIRVIRRLGGPRLPQPADLVGIEPDLTGDLPSEAWLKRRRSG